MTDQTKSSSTEKSLSFGGSLRFLLKGIGVALLMLAGVFATLVCINHALLFFIDTPLLPLIVRTLGTRLVLALTVYILPLAGVAAAVTATLRSSLITLAVSVLLFSSPAIFGIAVRLHLFGLL